MPSPAPVARPAEEFVTEGLVDEAVNQNETQERTRRRVLEQINRIDDPKLRRGLLNELGEPDSEGTEPALNFVTPGLVDEAVRQTETPRERNLRELREMGEEAQRRLGER
jgi:hypothetical protein